MPTDGEVTPWHSDGHMLFVFVGEGPIMVCPFDRHPSASCTTGAKANLGVCRLSVLDGIGMGEIDAYFVCGRFEIYSPIELVWRERFVSGGGPENPYWYLELQTIEVSLSNLRDQAKAVFLARNQQALRLLLGNRSKRELETILDAVESVYDNASSSELRSWWFGDIQIGEGARTCRFYTEFLAATTKSSKFAPEPSPDQPG